MVEPTFNIVVSSECTVDDILLLRKFRCCDAGNGAHEWEMEPQRHIRGLSRSDFDEDVKRIILTTEDRSRVFAFAEYGYLEEARIYSVAWIARAASCVGNRLGEALLRIVIDDMAIDSYALDRGGQVVAQIDPQNEPSKRMAESQGFSDCGIDPEDQGFHIWSLTFTPHSGVEAQREFVTKDLLHPHRLVS